MKADDPASKTMSFTKTGHTYRPTLVDAQAHDVVRQAVASRWAAVHDFVEVEVHVVQGYHGQVDLLVEGDEEGFLDPTG